MIDYDKELADFRKNLLLEPHYNNDRNSRDFWKMHAEQSSVEIKELKQQISELHASRESLLEYKSKIESDQDD